MNKKTLIIHNPKSGPKSTDTMINQLIDQLKQANKTVQINQTKYAGHATKLCQNIDLHKYNNLIICGGDGTFNEVLNGLMLHKEPFSPTLGFLPGGTGNAFMHDLKATNPKIAIQKIIKEKTKKIDILKLEFTHSTEYAINIVGWGMVTDILILAEKMRWVGSMRYSLASLYYIFNKATKRTKCIIDSTEIDNKKYIFILICNTIHTGKGMQAAPKALIDDGFMDIILLKSTISKLQLLKLFPQIFSGAHIKSPYIEYLQAKKIKLIPETKDVLNIDGEAKCLTPVRVSVIPKKISIFY